GFNLTEAALCTALGVDYPASAPTVSQCKQVASCIFHVGREGIFDGVSYADDLKEFVVEERLFVSPGDRVSPYTSGDRALGLAFFVFPNEAVLRDRTENIEHLVQAVSAETLASSARPCKGASQRGMGWGSRRSSR